MGPGGFRRLQNGCDPTTSGRVGSIPARSRHFLALLMGLLITVSAPCASLAQQRDSARAGVTPPPPDPILVRQRSDTLGPPISPGRAFLYSLILPGLGQSRLGRPSAGAMYFGFELTSVAMLSKSAYDLSIAKRRFREHVVNSYEVDAMGRPVLDPLGIPVPADTVPNRYAPNDEEDELRSRLKARRLHYEDWVAMLLFTHLFSGADAFVAAQLWDLPTQVGLQRLPGGATGIGARVTVW